ILYDAYIDTTEPITSRDGEEAYREERDLNIKTTIYDTRSRFSETSAVKGVLNVLTGDVEQLFVGENFFSLAANAKYGNVRLYNGAEVRSLSNTSNKEGDTVESFQGFSLREAGRDKVVYGGLTSDKDGNLTSAYSFDAGLKNVYTEGIRRYRNLKTGAIDQAQMEMGGTTAFNAKISEFKSNYQYLFSDFEDQVLAHDVNRVSGYIRNTDKIKKLSREDIESLGMDWDEISTALVNNGYAKWFSKDLDKIVITAKDWQTAMSKSGNFKKIFGANLNAIVSQISGAVQEVVMTDKPYRTDLALNHVDRTNFGNIYLVGTDEDNPQGGAIGVGYDLFREYNVPLEGASRPPTKGKEYGTQHYTGAMMTPNHFRFLVTVGDTANRSQKRVFGPTGQDEDSKISLQLTANGLLFHPNLAGSKYAFEESHEKKADDMKYQVADINPFNLDYAVASTDGIGGPSDDIFVYDFQSVKNSDGLGINPLAFGKSIRVKKKDGSTGNIYEEFIDVLPAGVMGIVIDEDGKPVIKNVDSALPVDYLRRSKGKQTFSTSKEEAITDDFDVLIKGVPVLRPDGKTWVPLAETVTIDAKLSSTGKKAPQKFVPANTGVVEIGKKTHLPHSGDMEFAIGIVVEGDESFGRGIIKNKNPVVENQQAVQTQLEEHNG
ncbi:MAG: hypothetical protein KC713_09965, partial [Candidatus Omnitrophica bacterium]|nr:hypothetical protein [Candidatus Omnitrophota bacterium]